MGFILLLIIGVVYTLFIFRCIHFSSGFSIQRERVPDVEHYLAAYSCIRHYEKDTAMDYR